MHSELDARAIDLIYLVAPTTTPERAELICRGASGFIYYVSLKGVTGADHIDPDSVKRKVDTLRAVTDLPILVGFGIKNAESARRVAPVADGIVVGSALVDTMGSFAERTGDALDELPAMLENQLSEFRAAIDRP